MNLLQNRNFIVMWIGQLATILGNRFSEIAIPLIVLQLTGSPLNAALALVCQQLAPLLLSLSAGNFAEGRSKKKIAMGADAVSFLTMLLLAGMVLINELTLWTLGAALFILGAAGVFFRVSFGAMVPGVAGRSRLVEAHTYFEGADAVSTLAGPVLAGLVLSAFGAVWALAVDAFTFFISFLGILFLTVSDKRKEEEKEGLTSKGDFSLNGISLLVKNPLQRFVTFNQAVLSFTTTAMTLTVIVYTTAVLDFREWQTGVVLSAAGAGNVIGVLFLHKLSRLSWRMLYGGLMGISAAGIFLIMGSSHLYSLALGMFLFDGALSVAFVINGSARQAITPDSFLARIGGAGLLLGGTAAISGNLFAGGVSESADPRAVIGFCGFLLLFASVIAFTFKQGKRSVRELEPIDLDE
ncbi:MFS transporter [Jeotgalibacillus proteolyticus]|uniref:MFS transporter n=1 Tax=Jeotgalibacillus proteolyticus TaxID=2082395 RepID=UPI003CFB5CDA